MLGIEPNQKGKMPNGLQAFPALKQPIERERRNAPLSSNRTGTKSCKKQHAKLQKWESNPTRRAECAAGGNKIQTDSPSPWCWWKVARGTPGIMGFWPARLHKRAITRHGQIAQGSKQSRRDEKIYKIGASWKKQCASQKKQNTATCRQDERRRRLRKERSRPLKG